MPTPAPTPAPGQNDGNSCHPFNPVQSGPFVCRRFQELQPWFWTLNIPSRDSRGTCYFVKLIDQSRFSPSWSNPWIDAEVISRNHDKPGYTANDVHNPYVLGRATIGLYMHGSRTMKLAGAPSASANILVDNFILVGLAPWNRVEDPAYYKAYGTEDSTVGKTGSVYLNRSPIALTPFASGGTSTIAPLEIDGLMETNALYQLDVRALDAGSVGNNSDIFLVIQ